MEHIRQSRPDSGSSDTFRVVPSSLKSGLNDVIRKEAWLFCRTSSGVRLCWELEEPKGPKGGEETEVDDVRKLVCTDGLVDATLQALPGHAFRSSEPHQPLRDRLSGWREGGESEE